MGISKTFGLTVGVQFDKGESFQTEVPMGGTALLPQSLVPVGTF